MADPPWPYADGPTARQRARGDATFLPYSSMALSEITRTLHAVDAVIDAHLYLWTTQRFLWASEQVTRDAGYLPQQVLVWCKPSNGAGMGHAFAPTVEFCLFARRNWGIALDAARRSAGLTVTEVHETVRGGRSTALVSMWMRGERYPNERDWARLGALLGEPFDERAGLPNGAESAWLHCPRGKHSAKPDAFYDLVERVSPEPRLELFARRARFGWDYWGDQSLGTAELPEAVA